MIVPYCESTIRHTLRLNADEVHVWYATLDREASRMEAYRQALSPGELARADRFRFEEDRHHFIVARGLLRLILSRYLDVEPAQLRFCYGRYGKPALANGLGEGMLSFNLAHAEGLALYAVARGRQIGVDVEHIRADYPYQEVVERFFSWREQGVLRALPQRARCGAFFAGWTRKEAYLKARGEGLSLPLHEIEVTLAPREPALLLSVGGDAQEARRWALHELKPHPGYAAAVAVEGRGWRLGVGQWTDL
jgi:4'-phosphopantetheinyl transferase